MLSLLYSIFAPILDDEPQFTNLYEFVFVPDEQGQDRTRFMTLRNTFRDILRRFSQNVDALERDANWPSELKVCMHTYSSSQLFP